jgi:DNA-binding protein H-NS
MCDMNIDKDVLVILGSNLNQMNRKDKNRKIRDIVEFIINNNLDFSLIEKEYLCKTKQFVKYKNPLTGETWSGRGRQPKWVQDWVANGGKIDQLVI